jgi:hypothetical protein
VVKGEMQWATDEMSNTYKLSSIQNDRNGYEKVPASKKGVTFKYAFIGSLKGKIIYLLSSDCISNRIQRI